MFKTSDFVVFDRISHHIINKYYKWCYIIIFFLSNIHTFGEVPTADPELSYVNYLVCLIISKYVIKKLHKIKNAFKYWSVVKYLQINI